MRLTPIDQLRGIVMILMTSDHAAHVFYSEHLVRDSAMIRSWSDPLPAGPFLHRWLSHLCAPTFVFLAGTAIALSIATRSQNPSASSAHLDRDLVVRGLLLIGIDFTLISWLWAAETECRFMLQVLFAIGVGMIAMAFLRRLPGTVVAGLGIAGLLAHEAICGWLLGTDETSSTGSSLWVSATITGGFHWPDVAILYPAWPWVATMAVGYGYGARLSAGRDPIRPLLVGGGVAIAGWIVVSALDGYGNLAMTGQADGPLRWLQTSKYPPSLAFTGLELGIMAVLLAGLFWVDRRRSSPANPNGPLLLFGQTALFFYILHIPLLTLAGALGEQTGWADRIPGGLLLTWLAVGLTLILLYPLCRGFRTLKRSRPKGPWRYV